MHHPDQQVALEPKHHLNRFVNTELSNGERGPQINVFLFFSKARLPETRPRSLDEVKTKPKKLVVCGGCLLCVSTSAEAAWATRHLSVFLKPGLIKVFLQVKLHTHVLVVGDCKHVEHLISYDGVCCNTFPTHLTSLTCNHLKCNRLYIPVYIF